MTNSYQPYFALGLFSFLLFHTCFGLKIYSQNSFENQIKPIQCLADTNHVDQLLQLGDPITTRLSKQSEISTALLYSKRAKYLSDSLDYPKGQILSNYYLAYIFSKKGDNQQAIHLLLEGIKISKESGYHRQGADGWYTKRDTYTVTQEQLTQVIHLYKQALVVSKEIGNRQIEADILNEIAFLYHQQGEHAQGAGILEQVLVIYDSINYLKRHYVYDLLAAIHQSLGNYPEALKYSLATIKSAQSTNDTTHIANFYIRLGMIYRDLKKIEDGLECFKNALRYAQEAKQKLMVYNALSLVSSTLILSGKKEEGLAVVLNIIKVNPPENQTSKILVSEILANCYHALKQYTLAERYFIEMLNYQAKRPQDDQYKMIVMQKTSQLYLDMKEFAKSEYYLQQAVLLNKKLKSVQSAISQQLLIFRLDSAQGRFQEAIGQYQRYKDLQDSIFNQAKSNEIARLEVQYASEQREKDLLLKEYKIAALTKENLLQEEKMKKDQLIRYIMTGGAIILLCLLSVIYNRYRLKRHSNYLLEIKQQEIYDKNESLQQVLLEKNNLLAEKESLLKHKDTILAEKEWLLKEIHHRVKNNLQIVMSLLNSQADYLKDSRALAAIQESQQRVYAISLIHQKLYQSKNLALIEMDNYINELVAYISESFNMQNRIHFNMSVAFLKLDISMAIPLGLIINEAITNSLKYAFPSSRKGSISITLGKIKKERYSLIVEDDGIGLEKGFNINETHSLGMTLMKGLSEQLDGSLKITSKKGVQISLIFYHPIPIKIESNEFQFA